MIRGGADEARHLDGSFGNVVGVMRRMLRQERHLMWLGSGYGMVAAALPLLLAGPAFFAGAIGLGALVQLGQAFAAFYRDSPVLKEPDAALQSFRIALCVASQRTLAAALGLPRLLTDGRFASNALRHASRAALKDELEAVLRTADARHWLAVLEAGREIITWQPVASVDVGGPDLDPAPRAVVRLAPVHVPSSWEVEPA